MTVGTTTGLLCDYLKNIFYHDFFMFASSASVETESDDKTEPVDELDAAIPESPIPDLPPRAPGVVVSEETMC